MNKAPLSLSVILALIFGFVGGVVTVGVTSPETETKSLAGAVNYQTDPVFAKASSTVFTLSGTSARLLASSTPTRRVAATIQPVNCTGNNGAVFMNTNGDNLATVSTGPVAYGSTTFAFGAYPNIPSTQNSVQGITDGITCKVLVTEWRLQF